MILAADLSTVNRRHALDLAYAENIERNHKFVLAIGVMWLVGPIIPTSCLILMAKTLSLGFYECWLTRRFKQLIIIKAVHKIDSQLLHGLEDSLDDNTVEATMTSSLFV